MFTSQSQKTAYERKRRIAIILATECSDSQIETRRANFCCLISSPQSAYWICIGKPQTMPGPDMIVLREHKSMALLTQSIADNTVANPLRCIKQRNQLKLSWCGLVSACG